MQGTPANGACAKGTPGSQRKQVSFQLKKNLYFQKGGEVPSPDLRTPDSCKPKVDFFLILHNNFISSWDPDSRSRKAVWTAGT